MGRTRQPAPVELEIEVTGTTRRVGAAAPCAPVAETMADSRHPTLAERLAHGGEIVLEGIEHARGFHAAPGPRPGAVPGPAVTSTRDGGGTDIVRPVLVDPATACRLAASGELFAAPIPHLSVHGPGDAPTLTWDAAVLSGRRGRRRATLHLMASPSMVVTVIELVPCRPVRRGRSRFIAHGVEALEELAHRLERTRCDATRSPG